MTDSAVTCLAELYLKYHLIFANTVMLHTLSTNADCYEKVAVFPEIRLAFPITLTEKHVLSVCCSPLMSNTRSCPKQTSLGAVRLGLGKLTSF